ncbi:uridine monophosphate kinase [Candidatus Peregrinibacteria bacterium]|nr:uridine monophosphate kinase [Candidatus Peregrinibacteria bacterium]
MGIVHKRILLKLSGEVLAGKHGKVGVALLKRLAGEIRGIISSACAPSARREGYKFVIIIGGGNIWRYRDNKHLNLDRVDSDNIGMLATIMNALIIENIFNKLGIKTKAVSALSAPAVIDDYSPAKAEKFLRKNDVLVVAGGTGKPFVTTDSGSAMRASELKCSLLAKATNVDFAYDKDPKKFKNSRPFKRISYKEAISRKLGVMDLKAISLCMAKKIPIIIFNAYKKGNLADAVLRRSVGTIIT